MLFPRVVHTNKEGEGEMKKMLLVMAAGALFAAGSATADTVTSVNVVGYYSVTIPANQLALVTPVLEDFQTGTVADLFGDELPVGSTVYQWDRSSNGYNIYNYNASFGGNVWKDGDNQTPTNIILRGDAMWVQPNSTNEITVTFMGEVPGIYNQAETTTVENISVADAIGYTYPVDMLWTNTAIAQSPDLSTVHFWNGTGWDTYNKSPGFGGVFVWDSPDAETKVLKAGEAFWVEINSPTNWVEHAPYLL